MRLVIRSIYLIIQISFSLALTMDASQIRVRLFASAKPESAIFTPITGDYRLEIPGLATVEIPAGEKILLYKSNDKIIVKSRTLSGFLVDSVRIKGSDNSKFSLSSPGSDTKSRVFEDDLFCRNNHGIFLLLNETSVEKIIPGIVRTEGGAGKHPEFNKTQAIITRTFAYRNIEKHLSDGYNLCDDVHCQAYHGVTDDESINAAVLATADVVITDTDSLLIMAAFHSNCGGETVPASEAWVTDVPYLKKVTDPYCLTSPNAEWSTTIPVASWNAFLVKTGYPGNVNNPLLLTFSQHDARKPFYAPVDSLKIPVTAIRAEFALRSSFFSFSPEGQFLSVKGRGYGHGVGLCQEGAMLMAKGGSTFGEIISFYYSDVHLMKVKDARLPPPVY